MATAACLQAYTQTAHRICLHIRGRHEADASVDQQPAPLGPSLTTVLIQLAVSACGYAVAAPRPSATSRPDNASPYQRADRAGDSIPRGARICEQIRQGEVPSDPDLGGRICKQVDLNVPCPLADTWGRVRGVVGPPPASSSDRGSRRRADSVGTIGRPRGCVCKQIRPG
jgi:hypothetical protein